MFELSQIVEVAVRSGFMAPSVVIGRDCSMCSPRASNAHSISCGDPKCAAARRAMAATSRALRLAQHRRIADQLRLQRLAVSADAIAVAIRLAADQLVRQTQDRADHHNAAIARHRIGRERHARGTRLNHHLNNDRRRLRRA